MKKLSSSDPEKQSKTPRPSGMGPTAHLPHQTKEKTWGESNEKTLSVHTARREGGLLCTFDVHKAPWRATEGYDYRRESWEGGDSNDASKKGGSCNGATGRRPGRGWRRGRPSV